MALPLPRVLLATTGWPSGLLDVGSWAAAAGLAEVRIVQYQLDETGPVEAFFAELRHFAPHLVGFRLEAGGLDEVRRSIAAVRQTVDAEVVVGGPTATSHPVEVLEATAADYVFAGEAEETFNLFLRLARERNSRDRLAEIPGLAYRHGGRAIWNTLPQDGYERTAADDDRARRCLQNRVRPLAAAEVVAANRLDYRLLHGFVREFDSLYFTGGRGCPGQCAFCAQLHGVEVRTKSARQILDEIEAADARAGDGGLRVSRWDLFAHADLATHRGLPVAWAAIYDEDFFLHRRRACEFFALWADSPLRFRYRLSMQTNPSSLLDRGQPATEAFQWIDRLKPMIQLGAESFHPAVLARWRKRHTVEQLTLVLDALETTRQDYTAFILLTDFDTTVEELIESLRRLALAAARWPRMRIASSPFTIPLYDSPTRRLLDRRGLLPPGLCFADYERPRPDWMDPLVAELADLADAELTYALQPVERDAAIGAAVEAVAERLEEEFARTGQRMHHERLARLVENARRARDEVRQSRYRAVVRPYD